MIKIIFTLSIFFLFVHCINNSDNESKNVSIPFNNLDIEYNPNIWRMLPNSSTDPINHHYISFGLMASEYQFFTLERYDADSLVERRKAVIDNLISGNNSIDSTTATNAGIEFDIFEATISDSVSNVMLLYFFEVDTLGYMILGGIAEQETDANINDIKGFYLGLKKRNLQVISKQTTSGFTSQFNLQIIAHNTQKIG